MIYDTDSFSRIEAMIRKHAPLLCVVGEPEPKRDIGTRLIGAWRPKIHPATVAKMRRLRASGMSIGEIARAVRVTYRTTQRYLVNVPDQQRPESGESKA